MYVGQISSPCECLRQRGYPVEQKQDRHETLCIEEGAFPKLTLVSDMYLYHWNPMELWKVVFVSIEKIICKFK